MSRIINNIGQLKADLVARGWHMTAFPFKYNGISYDVLFENNDDYEKRKNQYASVTLHFIDVSDPERRLSIEANQVKLFYNPREFREFFHIQYRDNIGDIFRQFFIMFLNYVPPTIPKHLNDRQNRAIDMCLAGRGGHDPNAIYCYDARRLGKRNGEQMHRSIFISNLARRRNPILYDYFENEESVTFYFSPRESDALDDAAIIHRFVDREANNRS